MRWRISKMVDTDTYVEESIYDLKKRKSKLLLRVVEVKDERGKSKRWGKTLQAWFAGTHTWCHVTSLVGSETKRNQKHIECACG